MFVFLHGGVMCGFGLGGWFGFLYEEGKLGKSTETLNIPS